MTGKERFLAAFAHQPVDRVPLFEQSVANSVASELLGRPALTGTTALHRDQAEAAIRGPDEYEAFLEQVLSDNVALADHLGHSGVSAPWLLPWPATKKLSDTDYLFGDPDRGPWRIFRFDAESQTFATLKEGGMPRDEVELKRELDQREAALKDYRPTPADFPRQRRLAEMVGDRIEVVGQGGIAIPLDELWMLAIRAWPHLVERHLDLSVEAQLRSLECQARMGRKVIWAGGDLADNRGPTYGPQVFRKMVLPRVQRITERCRELGLYYLFRTDGKLWSIGDELFVQSGVHGYGEIDVDAGMDLVELRRRFPRLTLWGGLSCGRLLRCGTPDEVRAETRRIIDGVGRTGLILGSSNSILHGTPAENVLAMVDEAAR